MTLACNTGIQLNWNDIRKGGGFCDKLGAEVGTENPINVALATFIDR